MFLESLYVMERIEAVADFAITNLPTHWDGRMSLAENDEPEPEVELS